MSFRDKLLLYVSQEETEVSHESIDDLPENAQVLINAMSVPMSVFNVRQGKIIYSNRSYRKLEKRYGAKSHNNPNRNTDACPWILDQDRELYESKIFPTVKRYCSEHIHFNTEQLAFMYNLRKCKKGLRSGYPQILVQSNILMWNNNHEPQIIMNLYIDIEDRKHFNKTLLTIKYARSEDEPLAVAATEEFLNEPNKLGKREKEILKYIVEDYSASQIAKKLGISKFTVRAHWRNILRKTECNSQKELKTRAQEEGWV